MTSLSIKLILILGFFHCLFANGQNSIDKEELKNLLTQAEITHSDAIVIYLNDSLYFENYFGKGKEKIESMSVTKSIVSLAIGKLLADNKIRSLDQPIYEFYPEWKQGLKQNITIRHLLNHTSGIQSYPKTGAEIDGSPDLVQLALCAELCDSPGTKFFYNNKAVNLLAGIIEKASGEKMDKYIEETIFKPLGITDINWRCDSAGNPHVMDGLQIFPGDLAKIGILVQNKGKWKNLQIIPEEWFNISLSPGQTINPTCGLLWWLIPDSITYIIDDNQIKYLEEAGVKTDFIEKAKKVKGTYLNQKDYYSKLESVFGTDWQQVLNDNLLSLNLSLSKKEYTYKGVDANGWLGQYLVIFPEKKLVGVRMIKETNLYNPDTDAFYNFGDMLYKLIK
jgi:CubicO group peptidase (beta-lactamase class C family)